MLSGGVDSVALLKKLLEETDEKIYTHHLHIKNDEGKNNFKRYKAEAKALRKIIPYMKKTFRDFHYTESTIDIRQIMNLLPAYYEKEDTEFTILSYIPDQTFYSLIGGLLAKITHSPNIYIGTCKEDYNSVGENIAIWFEEEQKENMDKITEGGACPFKPKIQKPHDELTKKQNIEYLGKELMDMVWYCRHPIEKNGKILSCNTNLGIYKRGIDLDTGEIFKCRSCRVVSDALIEIKEEETQRGIKYA